MKIYPAVLIAFALSSCVTVPTVESMVEEGGMVIEGGLASVMEENGVTLTGVKGEWTSFFAPTGEKMIHIKPENVKETLTWRINSDGMLCEMKYRPRVERCDDENTILVKTEKGVYSIFTDGKMGQYPFTVTSGNINDS